MISSPFRSQELGSRHTECGEVSELTPEAGTYRVFGGWRMTRVGRKVYYPQIRERGWTRSWRPPRCSKLQGNEPRAELVVCVKLFWFRLGELNILNRSRIVY